MRVTALPDDINDDSCRVHDNVTVLGVYTVNGEWEYSIVRKDGSTESYTMKGWSVWGEDRKSRDKLWLIPASINLITIGVIIAQIILAG